VKRYLRHSWIGLAVGLASSPALLATQKNIYLALALAGVIGVSFALVFRHSQRAYIDSLMTGAAFGIPLWASLSIIIFPIIHGQMPQWTAVGMRAMLPQLTGWVLYGASAGLLLQVLRDLAFKRTGTEAEVSSPRIVPNKHIVILGGGFGRMATGESLEHFFGADQTVEFTLVSETNALLFTPMLAEVAGSSLEPTHISSPLRTALHRTRVIRGRATQVRLGSPPRDDHSSQCIHICHSIESRSPASTCRAIFQDGGSSIPWTFQFRDYQDTNGGEMVRS